MKHLDLFSGIGGFSQGLKQAGFPILKTYFSEVDKYAISVYKKQFPKAEYLGGVESVSTRGFKGRDTIVTFGFPCQDLSVAGKRKGFDGSRSSLFFEAMRIIGEIKPRIFIFENVKGFYSSNNGKDFQIALQTIADLGVYECQWQLLNTAWFLPQNRERIYFVGSLGTESVPKVFPIRDSNKSVQKKGYGKDSYAGCINTRSGSGQSNFDGSTTLIGDFRADEGLRIRKNNISSSLCARARNDGNGQPVVVQPVLTPDRPTKRQIGRRFKENGEPSFTLTGQDKHGVMINSSIRRLTPTECEKLQGFPPGWTKYGHEDQEISDTQRYKQCGNAVSVPVVQAIGERLI